MHTKDNTAIFIRVHFPIIASDLRSSHIPQSRNIGIFRTCEKSGRAAWKISREEQFKRLAGILWCISGTRQCTYSVYLKNGNREQFIYRNSLRSRKRLLRFIPSVYFPFWVTSELGNGYVWSARRCSCYQNTHSIGFFYCVHPYNAMLIFEYITVSECNKIRFICFRNESIVYFSQREIPAMA